MPQARKPKQPPAIWVKTEQLVPWIDNPMVHSPDQVARLCQSIVTTAYDAARERGQDPETDPDCVNLLDGWGNPLQIRVANKEIIAGHGRLLAAHQLNIEWVPCRPLGISETQAHRLARADNRIAELAEWDEEKFLRQLQADMPSDEELAHILDEAERDAARIEPVWAQGFDDDYIDALLAGQDDPPPDEGKLDDPPAGEPPKNPITKLGDVWELGRHVLLCGDSTIPTDVQRLIEGCSPKLVITDPPYAIYGSSTGISSDIADDRMVVSFFEAVFRACFRILPNFGHVYAHCDWRSWAAIWEGARRGGIAAKNCIVWDKGDGGLGAMYTLCHELVFFGSKKPKQRTMKGTIETGERTVYGKPNVIRVNRPTGVDRPHNASKPVALCRELMVNSSDLGDVVVDFFAGGGTVLITAEQLDRVAHVNEIDPGTCDIIVERWQQLTGGKAKRRRRAA